MESLVALLWMIGSPHQKDKKLIFFFDLTLTLTLTFTLRCIQKKNHRLGESRLELSIPADFLLSPRVRGGRRLRGGGRSVCPDCRAG